jgi:type VI secretion system protein ImpJ
METNRPIYWHQGLLLQPQHFQLADLYYQSALTPFHRFQMPHFWGVGSLEIRESALGSQNFDIYNGEFIFPDGTYVSYPGSAHFVSRSFGDKDLGSQPLRVMLGLRKWNPAGDNVTEVERLEDAPEITTRFVTTTESEEVNDLYQNGPPAAVKRLQYVLRIFWGDELDELNEYDLIPLVDLSQEAQEIGISDYYIPPSVSINASARLSKLCREIRDQVITRCKQLEDIKTTRSMKTADFEMGDFINLLALRSLGRYVPVLQHITEAPDVHPWQAYQSIRQLAGELTTFSDRFPTAVEAADSQHHTLPTYDHRALHSLFNTAQTTIALLLDEIILGGDNIVRLREEGGILVGDVPQSMFDPRNQYVLILRTDKPPEWVVDNVKTVAKLSSKDSIGNLVSRFVSGVPLEYLPYAPPGVPRLNHAVYFRIDHKAPLWQEVIQTGGVALNWDTAPDDLAAEIVVQRGG